MPIVAVAEATRVPAGLLAGSDFDSVVHAVQAAGPGRDVVLMARDAKGFRDALGARLAFGAEHVGVLYCDMPPTAFYAATAVCQNLPEDALGLAAVAVATTLGSIRTMTYLSSVTAVEQPATSFGQHVQSLFPWTKFMIDRRANTVSRAKTFPRPEGVAIVVAQSQRRIRGVDFSDWTPVRADLPPERRSMTWKASRWLEVTALDHSIEAIVGSVLHPQHRASYPICPICERVGWGERCVFCQLPLVAREAPVPLATTSGGFQ